MGSIPLHTRMLIGFVVGAGVGLTLLYLLVVTAAAVSIGLVCVNLLLKVVPRNPLA